jgi:hypothetical protein
MKKAEGLEKNYEGEIRVANAVVVNIDVDEKYNKPDPEINDNNFAISEDGTYLSGLKKLEEQTGDKLTISPINKLPLGTRRVREKELSFGTKEENEVVALPGYYLGTTIDPWTSVNRRRKHFSENVSNFTGRRICGARLNANEVLGIKMADGKDTYVRGPKTVVFQSPINSLGIVDITKHEKGLFKKMKKWYPIYSP